MNLLDRISKLVARSKTVSRIEWFPGFGQRRIIRDLNTALAAAETEEERWRLLLLLLPLWTTERGNETAQKIFGQESEWQSNEPLFTSGIEREPSERRYKIWVGCEQFTVIEITGEKELLERYDRELITTGHVITLDELNRRSDCK